MKFMTDRVLRTTSVGAFTVAAFFGSLTVTSTESPAFAYGPTPTTTPPTTPPPTTPPTTTAPPTTPPATTPPPSTTTPPTTAPSVVPPPPPVVPPTPPSGLAFTGIDAALVTAVGAGAIGAGGALVLASRKRRQPSEA